MSCTSSSSSASLSGFESDSDFLITSESDTDEEFLDAPYNYLLTLNIDWFSPFEHGHYSVGAVYLVIQIFPISIRNKPENIILVGIIPGPNEPELTLDRYLAPLIQELSTALAEGFEVRAVELGGQQLPKTIQLALTCVACDIPAPRKVCGFLGHRAKLGCNKCYKAFEHIKEDISTWSNYGGTSPDWIVGEVKYFLEVHIAHQVENAVVDLKQIFAFVHWRKPHQQKDIINQHVAYIAMSVKDSAMSRANGTIYPYIIFQNDVPI